MIDGNILDDDAPNWEQRLILIIFAVTLILPSFIYVGIGFIKNIRSKITSITFCYIFIELGFFMRLLYCLHIEEYKSPTIIYGIWCYFPPFCTTTAALLFLITLLDTLDDFYQTKKERTFGKFRYLIIIFIIYFWLLYSLAYALTAYYELVKGMNDSILSKIMFGIGIIFHTISGIVLTIITTKYLNEIAKLEELNRKNKVMLYLLIMSTILQLVLRVFQGVVNIINYTFEWQAENDIWFTVYIVGYFFLSDVFPSVCYTCFVSSDYNSKDLLASEKQNINESLKDVEALLKDMYDDKAIEGEHTGEQNTMNPSILSSFAH